MGRAISTGAVNFGLVTIPVKLRSASKDKTVRFHRLSPDGECRLRTKLYCPETGEEHDFSEMAKGYEVAPDQYVLDPKREIDELLSLLRPSTFPDLHSEAQLARALLPRFFPCKRLCVAKKRDRGHLLLRIAIDTLADFLTRFDYPAPLVELAQETEAFVGLDLRDAEGELTYPKTSFDGTL